MKKETIIKLLLCCLPLAWGFIGQLSYFYTTYLMHNNILGENMFIIRHALMLALVYVIYGKALKQSQKTPVKLYGYTVPIIPLPFFILIYIVGIIIFPFISNPFIKRSLIQGVVLSVILEELFTRSFFIKYKDMQPIYNLLWAIPLSASFSLMHWFYAYGFYHAPTWGVFGTKFINHFSFGILMSALAWKTKRIEVPITLHMLSNFVNLSIIGTAINVWWILNHTLQIIVLAS